ncbi:hypothetical protein BE221DRAFT_194695 [Ostreococcus tauri]|uniref:Uncharacterized protein n=1 Tax=Ostreococcus tauri TaxID=70448 RepID=A0A1Y5I5B7_OSTTA|nr:hypothetical protein BE221DRAFT_194695 [Ostreococcus tauri]
MGTARAGKGEGDAPRTWGRAGGRALAGALAVVLCALAMGCARAGGAAGAARDGALDEARASWAGNGILASVLANAALDGRAAVRSSLMVAAKVFACASAACAVAAVAPERRARADDGGAATASRDASAKASSTRDARSERSRRKSGDSPRENEGRSPRGHRTIEELARAKEAAKERKRRAREEQELIAKREEEERAEIARLVIQERARREAERAALAEEIATRAREEEEARAKAEAEEAERRAKEQLERDALEKKPLAESAVESDKQNGGKSSSEANGLKKIPAPMGQSKTGNKTTSPPRTKQPAPPRSTGLTLRKIPTPRMVPSGQAIQSNAHAPATPAAPLPSSAPPSLPPKGPPPLPRGPPPDYARVEPPLPPMAPMDAVRQNLVSFGTSGPPQHRAESPASQPQPVSPKSPTGLNAPPGFESAMPTTMNSYDQWAAVDSTIQSFLASTTGVEDDPFSYASRSADTSAYDNIFAPRKLSTDVEPEAPPLPPTPHPEILANVFRDAL